MSRYLTMSMVLILYCSVSLAEEPRNQGDGEGSVELVSKPIITVGTTGTWTFKFTVGEAGIQQQGGIAFFAPPFWGWSKPQNLNAAAPGYTTFTVSNPAVRIEAELFDPTIVIYRVVQGSLASGDILTITYGDTGKGERPYAAAKADRYAERSQEFLFKVDGDGDEIYHPLAACPSVQVVAGQVAKIHVVGPSLVKLNSQFEVCITALDYGDNLVEHYTGTVTLLKLEGFQPMAELSVTISERDRGVATLLVTATKPGILILTVKDESRGLTGKSNPIKVVNEPQRYRLVWGDLHGHTGLSDGTGTPDDYYRYARFVSGMDVAAVTDHDAHGLRPLDSTPSLWDAIKASAERAYVPGAFVTFIGYEWTNWTYGHKHVLFPGAAGEIVSFRNANGAAPLDLWRSLAPYGAMTIGHHPAGGPIHQDWRFNDPARERLVEVASIHGNSEYYGAPNMIQRPVLVGFVQEALKRQYKLGLVGGGDTHDGHPGLSYAGSRFGGVCALYVEGLTRESVWDALTARRVYATSGPKIILDFKMNPEILMGSSVAEIPAVREFTVSVVGTENLAKLELIRNAEVIASTIPLGTELAWNPKDETALSAPSYYYVRITQQDGQLAWSSPIWVGTPIP